MKDQHYSENIVHDWPHSNLAQVDIVDAIASWCEALYGTVSLEQAVTNLVQGLGAEAGMLVRTNMNENRAIRVATHDTKILTTGAPLSVAFADGQFGSHLKKPRTATIWLGSTHTEHSVVTPDPALGNWQAARDMKEFAVLILASGPVTRDHIELHFRQPLSEPAQTTLSTVLPSMARTWASRQVGLITRTVINHRLPSPGSMTNAPVKAPLAIGNPAHLSRAEFRVCLLLSRGLSVAGVCSELDLAETTVRSHLRNIYAKTETSSLAELIFCLIAPAQLPQHRDAVCA
ncbi:MAG: helix-turn-helix transcriptional regulator [Marinosulfonomonas sp.]|nr:helix-turn-helix transcriptional regulator [Marinosulfonomonas sp.]